MHGNHGKKPEKEKYDMHGKESGSGKGMKVTQHGHGVGKDPKETMNGPKKFVSNSIVTQHGKGSSKAGGEGYKM